MLLDSLTYDARHGFSRPLPACLDSPSTLVLAFGAREYGDPGGPLAEVCTAFPNSRVLGCSTAGEIHGPHVLERGLVVAVAKFERTRLELTTVELDHDSGEAARRAAAALCGEGLRGVFVVADGVRVNGSAVARELAASVPGGVGVSGGLAADDLEFARTWVLDHGVPREGVLAAVGFYGEACRIGHGWRCGWDVFGPERVVTRASGNVVYELDGKPALELYKMYLGERAYGLPATSLLFPLAIRTDLHGTHRVVRAALGVDETTASMRFGGEVPEGTLVQLMHANADRLVQGASQAAHRSAGPHGDAEPVLAIAVSCAGRRFVLGERTEDETEAVLESLPAATRQVGFYGYGELCPPAGGGCDLHNQAMTLTTVSEAP